MIIKIKMKKIKNRTILAILIISILILFSGCSSDKDIKESGFSIGKGTSKGSSSSKSGVNLEFANQNPPSEMIKGQPYTFAFVFKNFQEHEITDLEFKTKGFERGYVNGLEENYKIASIPPGTQTTGPGVYSGLVLNGVTVTGFEGNFAFNPEFDYCYSAKTNYIEQICVPSTMNQCDTQVEKYSKQNGPLSIKIDRITSLENKIRIDFVITNTGSGKVVNECFKTDDYANAYTLSEVKLGSQIVSCNTISGEKIISDKSNFYCEFPRNGESSYASQVSVKLDYKYQNTVKKNIKVIDLNQGYK